ncbi:MAG: amino acid ABC transporter permease [Rhizobiaceae bacterium]
MSAPASSSDSDFPYWLVGIGIIGAIAVFLIASSELYTQILNAVGKGLYITVFVTLVGFFLASAFGLLIAIMALSKSLIMRQIARFYVEVVRGIPMLVLLFYVAFVAAPSFVVFWNFVTAPLIENEIIDKMTVRDFPLIWRASIALMIGYSAFISEIFRAGIQAIDKGQLEAAQALGIGRWHRFRFIVFPQALRIIMPPLGNDFIAMVKDSSLVSVLGVADLTQMGKVYAAGSFRFFETYTIVALIYLFLTVLLSLGLRAVERRLNT